MSAKVETLLDGLAFPEGPRWHDGKLWFSDIFGGVVRAVDLSGRAELISEVTERPSGLGWTADNKLLPPAFFFVFQRRPPDPPELGPACKARARLQGRSARLKSPCSPPC